MSQGAQQGEVVLEFNGQKYAVPQEEIQQWMQAGAKKL